MADLKISDLPTDIVTLEDGDKFPVADASALTANTYATAAEVKTYANSDNYYRWIDSAYTLTNTTSSQVLFPTPNKITLGTGFYECLLLISLTSMSGTSGNASFQLNGPGATAVISNITMGVVGIDSTGAAAAQTGTWVNAATTPGNMVSAGLANSMFARIRAAFTVTTSGFMVPAISLANSTVGVSLSAGSYIRIIRVSDLATTSRGNWS